jgi:hypothetical protein
MAGTYYNAIISVNTQAASYTLAASDQTKDTLVEMNVATANTLTIPTNATVPFPIGSQILIAQYGAGQTTVTPAVGVTLRSNGAKTKLTGQYSMASLIKRGADEWYLAGDITT